MAELTELVTQCQSRIFFVRDQLAMGIDEIHLADSELRVARHQLRGELDLHRRFLEALRVVDRHSASVGTDFGNVMSWVLDAIIDDERRVEDLERRIAANAARMASLEGDLRALEPFIAEPSNLFSTAREEEDTEAEYRNSVRLAS